MLLDSAPELALQEVLGPGLVWCVALWREDGRERCLAMPYRPPPEAAR